jgi:hypothetical protein
MELVLLVAGSEVFVAEVALGAGELRVPDDVELNGLIRGLTFERTGAIDRDFGFVLFRRKF